MWTRFSNACLAKVGVHKSVGWANISGRMADQLREAIEERGTVGEEDGKIVMAEVVAGLRDLAQSAEILIIESVEPQSMLSAERSP